MEQPGFRGLAEICSVVVGGLIAIYLVGVTIELEAEKVSSSISKVLAVGPDGNIWYTIVDTDQVVELVVPH